MTFDNRTIVAILGTGEVGSAIRDLVAPHYTVLCKDLTYDEIAGHPVDILHVCIRYRDEFVDTVTAEIKQIKPSLTIIHTSAAPGATDQICALTGIPTVHAPVRGRHDRFAEYLRRFVMYVGPAGSDALAGERARSHLQSLGIADVVILDNARTTETGKQLSTLYYGWNIAFAKLVAQMCQEQDLDFDQVYTEFNQTYNAGYEQTLPNVRRPVLSPMPGPIGGHCVIPNAEILDRLWPNELTRWLLARNEEWTKSE